MQSIEKQTVLIVDDVPANIKVLADILKVDYKVVVARSGQEALASLELNDIDIILLDIVMPGMDGFEVCRRLKSNRRVRNIPVIFITVKCDELNEEQGLRMGAMDYITKPFNPTIVQIKVKNHLQHICFFYRNRLLLDATQEGIYGLGADGCVTFINPAAARMLGREKDEFLGEWPHALFHHSRADGTLYLQASCSVCSISDDHAAHQAGHTVFWRADGSRFPVAYTSSPTHRNGRFKGVVVVFRDVSEQRKMEKKDRDSTASRIAISALLETSIEPLSMERQLDVALDIILSVPWLSIEFKGSVFIMDEEEENVLVLQAQKGFPSSLLVQCARVPLGHCLCGLAAQKRQTVFSHALDERHAITFPGIPEHGHYCLPILAKGNLLGVLNCYVPHGVSYDAEVEAFLTSAANTLAGIIERRHL